MYCVSSKAKSKYAIWGERTVVHRTNMWPLNIGGYVVLGSIVGSDYYLPTLAHPEIVQRGYTKKIRTMPHFVFETPRNQTGGGGIQKPS